MERVGEHPVPRRGRSRFAGSRTSSTEQRAGRRRRGRASASRTPARRRGARAAARASSSRTTGSTRSATRSSGTAAGPRSRTSWRPGEAVELESTLVAPRPPGRYRLAFDLVEEFRFWFAEVGSAPLDLPVDVRPRIDERRLAVRVHGPSDPELEAALAAQEEPLVTEDAVAVAHLVAGRIPAPDWSRLLLDAHAEGYAAVGPAIEAESRGDRDASRPGRRAAGATRASREPLLLPSLLDGLEPLDARGPPRLRGTRRAVRGPRRRQTSVAIRSSDRLKTNAPIAERDAAATTV